jgi:hypothetical protein
MSKLMYGDWKKGNRISVVGEPQAFYLFIEDKGASRRFKGKEAFRLYHELKNLYENKHKTRFIKLVKERWK